MVYFSYTDIGEGAPAMSVLDAVDDASALTEATARLRDYPAALRAHVYNGDQSVGTVEAPAFGFAGVNNTVGFGSHASDPDPIPPLVPDVGLVGREGMTETKGKGSHAAQRANAVAAKEGKANPRTSPAAQSILGKKGARSKG